MAGQLFVDTGAAENDDVLMIVPGALRISEESYRRVRFELLDCPPRLD